MLIGGPARITETNEHKHKTMRPVTINCAFRARMAESTFGRLAVNDGKLVSRLRLGGDVTASFCHASLRVTACNGPSPA
jgi:hypothetical protein